MKALLAALATLAWLGVGAGLADETSPGAEPAGEVLAEGDGGTLTQDGVDAYIEALEFIMTQSGQPTDFDAEQRAGIGESLAAHYPRLPVEIQSDLANLRTIWDHYLQTWPMLAFEAKRDFAFTVLALAFGAERAAAAVGLEPDAPTGSDAAPR